MLTSAQVWSVLERYYDLREEWPISSTLGQIDNGSRATDEPVPPRLVFICEVGAVIEELTDAERDAIEAVYHLRQSVDAAEAQAKEASRLARWTSIKDVRDRRMRTRREWRSIAEEGKLELRRCRQRKVYEHAMGKLCIGLELMVLTRNLARVLSAV